MCLTEVTRQYKKTSITKKYRVGYKVFQKHGRYFGSLYYRTSERMIHNKIFASNNNSFISYKFFHLPHGNISRLFYRGGFHIFTNILDTKHYMDVSCNNNKNLVIKKVLYNNVVTVGEQDGMTTHVARKMKICRYKIKI